MAALAFEISLCLDLVLICGVLQLSTPFNLSSRVLIGLSFSVSLYVLSQYYEHSQYLLIAKVALALRLWGEVAIIMKRRRRARKDQSDGGTYKIEEVELTLGYIDITGYTSLAGALTAAELRGWMETVYSRILETMADFEVVGFIGDAIFFKGKPGRRS